MFKGVKDDLVGVCETAHAAHDSEDVVVDRVDVEFFGGGADLTYLHDSVVNSGEIACSCWLVFLWFEGEGVAVDGTDINAWLVLVISGVVVAVKEAVVAVAVTSELASAPVWCSYLWVTEKYSPERFLKRS